MRRQITTTAALLAALTAAQETVTTQADDVTVSKIAYLAESRFDLQNDFMSKMFEHMAQDVEDFSYELVNFTSEQEIKACLQSGKCLASLTYQTEPKGPITRELADDEGGSLPSSLPLPILDDPVITATIP